MIDKTKILILASALIGALVSTLLVPTNTSKLATVCESAETTPQMVQECKNVKRQSTRITLREQASLDS